MVSWLVAVTVKVCDPAADASFTPETGCTAATSAVQPPIRTRQTACRGAAQSHSNQCVPQRSRLGLDARGDGLHVRDDVGIDAEAERELIG